MKNQLILTAALAISFGAAAVQVSSPDGNVVADFDVKDGVARYSVTYKIGRAHV